jgi:small neutral amino acid transporter SnatA (MarC family)
VVDERNGEGVRSPIAVPPSTRGAPPTPAGPHPISTVARASTQVQARTPNALYIAALALILVFLVSLVALWIFRDIFENATDVTTVLSSLFAVVGTVVGAYFGIKASGDANDKAQVAIDRANEIANQALVELSPEAGKRVVDGWE